MGFVDGHVRFCGWDFVFVFRVLDLYIWGWFTLCDLVRCVLYLLELWFRNCM